MADPSNKSIARSLGEFFGHIIHGVKTDPSKRVVRKETESAEQPVPGGKVVLRRTTIEEVEFKPGAAPPGGEPRPGGPSGEQS
ncbi:MAG: hypothetical protein AMXMBFR58_14560 [Phycisphaerae bacterium]